MERRKKVVDLVEALEAVTDGAFVAIGGLWFHNKPMAAVRELVRRGVKDLTLTAAPPASMDADLLIGAGAVKRAYLAHVSFEHIGLAPNFRRAVEQGTVELGECDEATLLGGLMATVEGLPEHGIGSLKGTDHLQTSPLLQARGDGLVEVPALRPDVVILHAQEADEYGNVRCLGAPFVDAILAKAARHVVVTVDQLVTNAEVRAAPRLTSIPSYLVDAVVKVPFGAHPCSSHGRYPHDEQHLRDYIEGDFQEYLRRYVLECPSQDDYLEEIGETTWQSD